MSFTVVLAGVALAASVVLWMQQRNALVRVLAVIASALELVRALGLVRLEISHVPISLILGAIVAGVGVLAYLRSSAKTAVTAATSLALIGAVQVLTALRLLH